MIRHYNQRQQIKILNNCNNAKELLEIKELLEELQMVDDILQLVYERMMKWFLTNNKIFSYHGKNQ